MNAQVNTPSNMGPRHLLPWNEHEISLIQEFRELKTPASDQRTWPAVAEVMNEVVKQRGLNCRQFTGLMLWCKQDTATGTPKARRDPWAITEKELLIEGMIKRSKTGFSLAAMATWMNVEASQRGLVCRNFYAENVRLKGLGLVRDGLVSEAVIQSPDYVPDLSQLIALADIPPITIERPTPQANPLNQAAPATALYPQTSHPRPESVFTTYSQILSGPHQSGHESVAESYSRILAEPGERSSGP